MGVNPLLRAHAKWVLCGLLFLATLLNYLDRQTMSVAATPIRTEFSLSKEDFGKVLFAFYLSYGFAQILIGPLLDRLTVGLAFALAVGAWSLAGAAAAAAAGFWSLFFLRALLGVCESPNWPLALRAVARTFPPAQRAFANGTFQAGTSVGAVVAPPIIIYLATTYDWRAAFIACGLVGLLWIVLWLLWFRFQGVSVLTAGPLDQPAAQQTISPASLPEILRSRALWGMLLSTCFLNPLQYFYMSWLPTYFEEVVGMEFGRQLANRLMIAYFAYDIGLLLAGALVARLSRLLEPVTARLIVCGGFALCMLTAPAVMQLTDMNAITAVICVAMFGLGGCIVIYLAFTAEVSAHKVSTAAGILGGAGSLAGAGFMWLVGYLVDRSGFGIVFVLAGLMPLVSLAGMWFSTTRSHTNSLKPT